MAKSQSTHRVATSTTSKVNRKHLAATRRTQHVGQMTLPALKKKQANKLFLLLFFCTSKRPACIRLDCVQQSATATTFVTKPHMPHVDWRQSTQCKKPSVTRLTCARSNDRHVRVLPASKHPQPHALPARAWSNDACGTPQRLAPRWLWNA